MAAIRAERSEQGFNQGIRSTATLCSSAGLERQEKKLLDQNGELIEFFWLE